MKGLAGASPPGKPRGREEDDELARICEEMRTWLSGLPAANFFEATDAETKIKSSKSTVVDSSKADFESLASSKSEPDARATSERTTSEDLRRLGAGTILLPLESPAAIETPKSQLGTSRLEAQDGCDKAAGKQSEKTKSNASPHSMPSLTLMIEREADSRRVRALSASKVPEKTARHKTGSCLDYASRKGNQCLLGAWFPKLSARPSWAIPYESSRDKKYSAQGGLDAQMARVPGPETFRGRAEGPYPDYDDINWRRANMTSELHIEQEVKRRENLEKLMSMTFEQFGHKSLAGAGEEQWPEAKCLIRPAAPPDFAQIAEIINAEASNTDDTQVFLDKPTSADDVREIFDACTTNGRPFIVALPAQDDFLDQSKWPKGSDEVYQEFVKYMAAKPKPTAPVVGFAFVSDYRMSLYGTPCPASQYTGQVRLVVRADHQRKLYGSALIDRILLSVSPFYRSALDHKWKCDDPKDVYRFPVTHNRRQYTQLYLELFLSQDDSTTYRWKAEFLRKFGFQEVGYLKNAAVQMDGQHHNRWLTMVLWQSNITPTSKIVAQPQLSGTAAGDN
ncbi:Acyl-CoA N-acyltransferase [Metarhizium album ARSEF 1941]|uniref:Acyl-CoA N-acyltransferase n=1 Tax=Metarhizium album (strain ARSEF 1941) TaxID=1081103 RepID=A0A0B2X168_METAS|nr:Acyl-CoA N-acyltransferase [Metarhizium album ARSEF 1941]KHN99619.1 Acyl-CoA N-acyltransferase [Metarhizium album ARSEF 1941]